MNDGGLVMGAVGNIIVHVPYQCCCDSALSADILYSHYGCNSGHGRMCTYSLQVCITCTCTYLPWVVSEGGVV